LWLSFWFCTGDRAATATGLVDVAGYDGYDDVVFSYSFFSFFFFNIISPPRR
jgi:hypothetical protein